MLDGIAYSAIVTCCVLVVSPFCASAQNVPGVLSGVGTDASRAEAAALGKTVAPQGKAAAPEIAPPAVASDGAAGEIRDSEAKVVLVGDIAFGESQNLAARIEKALVDGASVNEALGAIRKELIDGGFYLVRLTPSYDSASRMLTVNVEAGAFGKINVAFKDRDGEDGRWFSQKQIERRFSDLKEGETFDYRALYRRLSEINASPDLTLDTHIKVRSVVEGEGADRRVFRYADLDLSAKESFPLHGMIEVNNYATEELDDWQGSITLQYLNLTKADDVLTLSPGITLNGDLKTFAASYLRPHHLWKGGAFTLYGGWSDLDSDNVVPRIDLEGTGWFIGGVESFKLIDTDRRALSLSGGILYRYIEDQFSAHINGQNYSLQERNVSVLPLTVSLSYADITSNDPLGGRNFAALSGVYNLWAGGDNDLDQMWYNAEEHYTIARLQLARLQPLFGGRDDRNTPVHQWTLYLRAEAQYSPDPLIPAEKLFLGGYHTVRGYTAKCALGDTGVYGTAELRTPILLDPVSHFFREKSASPRDRWQFLAFLDAGYAQMEDPLPGSVDGETMLSAGLGARLAVTSHSQFRFDYGIPLIDIDVDDDDSSGAFYVSGQLQF
jgi:hemolysin activation/secretion protein